MLRDQEGRGGRAAEAVERLESVGVLLLLGALCGVLGTGCGAAMLKEPIAGQCQSAGLKGCPELADGVVMYIDGDQKQAQEKLVTAAAANSPEDLSGFICAIKAIEMIPGAGDYMGPVLKVVEILEQAKQGADAGVAGPDGGGSGPEGSARASRSTAAPAKKCPRLPDEANVRTAATDPTRLRVGVAKVSPSSPGDLCYEGGRCAVVRPGPFIVTDLQTSTDCRMVAFAVDPLSEHWSPTWLVNGPLRIHGARLLVDGGSTFVVGTSETDPACQVLWAGFEPYSHEPAYESVSRVPSRERATSPSLEGSD